MKALFLVLFTLAFLGAFQSDEPFPGQREHREPPAGWMCEHQNYELSVPPEHACSCERMIDNDGVMHEDSTCSVFCHADHCGCGATDARTHDGRASEPQR